MGSRWVMGVWGPERIAIEWLFGMNIIFVCVLVASVC